MKNNNTRELNFNFIERQPIATEAYLLLLFGSTTSVRSTRRTSSSGGLKKQVKY